MSPPPVGLTGGSAGGVEIVRQGGPGNTDAAADGDAAELAGVDQLVGGIAPDLEHLCQLLDGQGLTCFVLGFLIRFYIEGPPCFYLGIFPCCS